MTAASSGMTREETYDYRYKRYEETVFQGKKAIASRVFLTPELTPAQILFAVSYLPLHDRLQANYILHRSLFGK